MTFDIGCQPRVKVCSPVCSPDNICLTLNTWRSESKVGDFPVTAIRPLESFSFSTRHHEPVDGRSTNDCAHWITIPNCIFQTFNVQRSDALCATVAVSCGVKRVACGRWRKDAELGGIHVLVNTKNQIDATDNRTVTFVISNSIARIVQRIERGRASGVDNDAIILSAEFHDSK